MNASREHVASAECAAAPDEALAFLADGLRLGEWALGAMRTQEVAPGVVRGFSLFDGSACLVRPVPDAAAATVTYHVGSRPAQLVPRIRAQVVPSPRGCTVSLHAWRTPEMDDARWLRLVRCHEVEILLIQARLGPAGATPPSTSP